MASLLERLTADEAAARQQLADLREQVAALEERLSELSIARKVIEPLLVEESAAQDANESRADQNRRPDPPQSAAHRGRASSDRRDLAGTDEQVVAAMTSAGRPMRAKEVAQALGEPQARGRVEATRARLKKLVTAGWLTQAEPGLFAIAAGWHYSGGDGPPTFGYSATLATAARTRATRGHFPQLALGLVIDTPHKRIGANAITTLQGFLPLGLPVGILAVDRAYTDQAADHFARPARALGFKLALDYKQDQRGVQGSVHGALLIDGNLACPLMPERLAQATTDLDDQTIRTPPEQLTQLIAAREPYWLKLKQGADAHGRIRLQCPAAGTSPSVTCPRFNRLHRAPAAPPTAVDLTNSRQRAAHGAAKPTVILPAGEPLRPPRSKGDPAHICAQTTITLHPDDLGAKDKFRQDPHYLTPAWQDTYKPIRANTECINGRLKGHHIDLGDPKNRLAHGRVAQILLAALMVATANELILLAWRQAHDHHEPPPEDTYAFDAQEPDREPPATSGRPPPGA
jgi:hypothetical protein